MLARRGYGEVNIVVFSGYFSLKNVLLMQSIPFAMDGSGHKELGAWHKPHRFKKVSVSRVIL